MTQYAKYQGQEINKKTLEKFLSIIKVPPSETKYYLCYFKSNRVEHVFITEHKTNGYLRVYQSFDNVYHFNLSIKYKKEFSYDEFKNILTLFLSKDLYKIYDGISQLICIKAKKIIHRYLPDCSEIRRKLYIKDTLEHDEIIQFSFVDFEYLDCSNPVYFITEDEKKEFVFPLLEGEKRLVEA